MPETNGEQCEVKISFEEPVEAKQQSKSANSTELMEPMELDQGQFEHGILCGDAQTEAMETNQQCVLEDSSFGVRGNFVQPSFAPPTEEIMETNQEPLLATPSDAHHLETRETTQKLTDACTPVVSPFEQRDAKKPLSSTVGVNALIAEQALIQSVMKPNTVCMVPEKQCCMQHDASIYNEHPQEMECEPFNDNLNFAFDQLESEVSNFSYGLDSDSDDDSQAKAYYDLGLGEQVLLLIDLLAWKALSYRVIP